MSLRQFLVIIQIHRYIAAAVFVGTVALAMLVCLCIPRQYLATASVVVEVKSDPLATSVFSDEALAAYLGTQVDIATSDLVAQRVIKALKFDEMPVYHEKWQSRWLSAGGQGDFHAWLAQRLLKKVSVKPSPQSNVIEIAVQWPDPKEAAALANAFAQAYIETNVELKVSLAKQYAAGFAERSEALRADLEVKQKALSDFEIKNGIVVTEDRLDVESARLRELSTQLVSIQQQRQDSQSREHQGGADSRSIPEVLQNSVVVSLKTDLAKSEARLNDLETSLGTNHPGYLSAQAEVNSLRERLAHESSQVVAALGNTTRVNQSRENALAAQISEQTARLLSLKHARDQVAVMQNDVATAQRNLDAVTTRLAQSSLEGSTQQTNVTRLNPATEPASSHSPKYLIVLGVSALGGLFLALATVMLIELSDPRIRTDDDVVQLLGIPIYGKIGRVAYPPLVAPSSGQVFPQLEPSSS